MPPRFPSFSGYDPQAMLADLPYPIRQRSRNPRFPLAGLPGATDRLLGPDYLSNMATWRDQEPAMSSGGMPGAPQPSPSGAGYRYGPSGELIDANGQIVADPNGNPIAQGSPVSDRDPNGPPRTEEEYWIQRWEIELADREAERLEGTRRWNLNRDDQRQGNLINTFGGYGGSPAGGGQRGVFSGGTRQADLSGPQQYVAEQNAMWDAARQQPGNYVGGGGPTMTVDPQTGHGVVGGTPFEAFGPKGVAKSPAGGAGGGGPHAASNAANRFFDSTVGNPEGEQAWAEYEKFVLENSPRASMLERGEDAGGQMTPAERAYLVARRRRMGQGRGAA